VRRSPGFPRAALAALATLTLLAPAGCASSKPKGPPKPDLRPSRSAADIRHPVIAVRKIARESGETVGYLKVNEDPGDARFKKPVRVYWVHDSFFKVLGFYTEQGETFRSTRDGAFDRVGQFDVDDAKRILLRLDPEQKLQLLMMDNPRTLQSERDAEEKAKAEAAAAAKKKEGEGGKPAEGEKPAE
jgi:hypothetical protein